MTRTSPASRRMHVTNGHLAALDGAFGPFFAVFPLRLLESLIDRMETRS